MAKISALPTASALTGSELIPVVQNGITKKTTANDIFTNGLLIESGEYNPNILAQNNVSLPVGIVTKYTRFGEIVTMSGWGLYTITDAPLSNPEFRIDLPIASTYNNEQDVIGVFSFQYFQDFDSGYQFGFTGMITAMQSLGVTIASFMFPENMRGNITEAYLSFTLQYKINS